MKRLRVLLLMHPTLVPPDDAANYSEAESYEWKTEWDVLSALRDLGHEVRVLGVQYELLPIRDAIEEWKPHVVFNLLEEFHGIAEFDSHVAGYLELLRIPYTGCNPRGLVLARGKALSKKLLFYHRIKVPAFAVVPRGRRARRTRGLDYPLIVKSLTEEASLGISQASVVDSDAKLDDRVRFIHASIGSDAIIEQFISGREIYVGVLGNHRLQTLPVWELSFENLPRGRPAIATARVKHNVAYQEKAGILQGPAHDLSEEQTAHIIRITKRAYKVLELDGYGRIDYRMTEDGELYFLEANPNPDIAKTNEFASAAAEIGIDYPGLIQKILNLARQRARRE